MSETKAGAECEGGNVILGIVRDSEGGFRTCLFRLLNLMCFQQLGGHRESRDAAVEAAQYVQNDKT
jgi:hypothetical protein